MGKDLDIQFEGIPAQNDLADNKEFTLRHLFLMGVAGMINGFIACCIALALFTGILRYTAKDVNFNLTRDQAISMARNEPGCRAFIQFYDQNGVMRVSGYPATADAQFGALSQNFFFDGVQQDMNDTQTTVWRVTVTSEYRQSPFLNKWAGQSKQFIDCVLLPRDN